MDSASKLIAIIEDDAVLRRGLRRVFVKNNFRVASFADSSTVFENLRDEKPDLILCDYRLPGTNGVEILKQLRKIDKQIPFFLMTSYYTDELVDSAIRNGANKVIQKPIEIKELIDSCILAVKKYSAR